MTMMFVNLPVKDLPASRSFFGKLGYSFNEQFSDDTAACMVVSDSNFVMLITEPKFREFITGSISDARKGTEVITCLTAASRAEVDEKLATALAHGAKAWKPNMEMGPMYGCSFQDLDGHVWEYMFMDQS